MEARLPGSAPVVASGNAITVIRTNLVSLELDIVKDHIVFTTSRTLEVRVNRKSHTVCPVFPFWKGMLAILIL